MRYSTSFIKLKPMSNHRLQYSLQSPYYLFFLSINLPRSSAYPPRPTSPCLLPQHHHWPCLPPPVPCHPHEEVSFYPAQPFTRALVDAADFSNSFVPTMRGVSHTGEPTTFARPCAHRVLTPKTHLTIPLQENRKLLSAMLTSVGF
jgi:hypothetical protein